MLKKRREAKSNQRSPQKRLRLWPGVIIGSLILLLRSGVPLIWPEVVGIFVLSGIFGTLAILIWWAFLIRASRSQRLGGVLLLLIAMACTWYLLHPSMQLMPFVAYIIPVMSLAFVAWPVASRQLSKRLQWGTQLVTVFLAAGGWLLVRTFGVTGEFNSQFAWRWSDTPEEQLLEQASDERITLPETFSLQESEVKWPGFR